MAAARKLSDRRLRRHARLNLMLRELIAERGAEHGAQVALAALAKTQPTYLAAMLSNDRGVGDEIAERLEKARGKPPGWFDMPMPDDADLDVGEPILLRPAARVPVVGEVKGGEDGHLDEMQYPTGHGDGFVEHATTDRNAYALRVRGDSMHPRFRAGEFVIVEPNVEAQPQDDVIVQTVDGRKMLKQLNWIRDGEMQLLSINNGYAPVTLRLEEVASVQRVAGHASRTALKR